MSNLISFLPLGLLFIVTYLLASLSSAIVICRLFNLPDPRTTGSKNPGATNVLRIGGKLPAFLTLLGDVLKGFIPVLVAALLFQEPTYTAWVLFVAFWGHCFPLYYGFEGGKGVATALGSLFAFSWLVGVCTAGLWLFMAFIFRFSSLASLVSLSLCPLFTYAFISSDAAIPLCMLAIIVIYRHRANVLRLWQGTESKIGTKKKA